MNSTAARLTEGRIIAIVRGVASEDMLPLVRALEAGGVRAIEVTFDQRAPESWPDTLRAIRAIADEFNGRVLPGAGTVLTPEQVRMAHDAGATYIISPRCGRGGHSADPRIGHGVAAGRADAH